MFKIKRNYWRGTIAVLVFILALAAPISTPRAQSGGNEGNPGVIPPHARPRGLSYGQWGAKWWQWIMGIPASVNPNLDPVGTNCGQGQAGPVWFLPQSFSGTVFNRTCTVPTGKHIFFPILTAVFGSGVFDCDPTIPGVPCDVAALRAGAAAWIDNPVLLEASIDGVPLGNLSAYRATSPAPFSLTLPVDAVFGQPNGVYSPHVTDGYWLMLAPLSIGAHTIHIKAISNPTLGYSLEGTTTIIVSPRAE